MQDTPKRVSDGLISPAIADSYTILEGQVSSGLVIVCDHASNAFPHGYGSLGLPKEQLARHIAYDIGAAQVTWHLSKMMSAPAIMTHFSRLLIDPNRGLDDPTLVMRISDGAVIPGNRECPPNERQKRVQNYYEPYHSAIDRVLDTFTASGVIPVLLSIHSFTDVWRGQQRPWHSAILYDQDPRFAVPLLGQLRASGDIEVGDNEPYSGRLRGDCMWAHGTMRGVAHALVELRQDLITNEAGQKAWAQRLSGILSDLLSHEPFRKDVGRLKYFQKPT